MISKISGYRDFQRITSEKDRKKYIKDADEKSQKVSPEEKIDQEISKNPNDSQNRDLFIAEYYRSLPMRLRIREAQSKHNEN